MGSLTVSADRLPFEAMSLNGQTPKIRPVGIHGVGCDVPEKILTNADLERMVETNDEWIVTRTGIRERRIVAEHESTSDLATRAAERALTSAGLTGADIDLVIVSTVTPDYIFPSTSSLVQHRIGANRAAAFDLAAGCSGFIYGLSTGAQFIASGMYQRVLVVGAETLSRIVDWTDRTTCVLFGDGAGAVVLGPVAEGNGVLSTDLGSDGAGAQMLMVESGPGRPYAGIRDACHAIRMQGQDVFKFAVKVIEDSTRRALNQAGLTVADVDWFICHQANYRIIDNAAGRLGIPDEKVVLNVAKYGNTSAASIPLALDEVQHQIQPRDVVVMVGFGAGLSWASCVIRWGQ